MLAALPGERPRREDLVCERDEEDSDRRGCELEGIRPPGPRNSKRRQAARELSDHGDALGFEIHRPRESNGGDDDEEGRRNTRPGETERQQDGKRCRAHREGRAADVAELTRHLHELPRHAACLHVEAEDRVDLRDDEHDRNAVDVPEENGARQVVRDPVQAEEPRDEEAGPDQERQESGDLHGLCTSSRREREDRRGDQGRDRPLRADDQPLRGAEQDVGNRGQQQRVEAREGREAGKLAVRHRGRERERGDGDAGEDVAARGGRPVPPQLGRDRDCALEERVRLRAPKRRRLS